MRTLYEIFVGFIAISILFILSISVCLFIAYIGITNLILGLVAIGLFIYLLYLLREVGEEVIRLFKES